MQEKGETVGRRPPPFRFNYQSVNFLVVTLSFFFEFSVASRCMYAGVRETKVSSLKKENYNTPLHTGEEKEYEKGVRLGASDAQIVTKHANKLTFPWKKE